MPPTELRSVVRSRLLPGARWGVPLVVVVALALAWTFLAEPLRVSAASMEPTLHDGDRVLVEKWSHRDGSLRRDDIVVFHAPDGGLAVKRVVAVGGESVGTESGVLVVDGEAYDETFVDRTMVAGSYFGPQHVPDGTVFVMGDNRSDSIDSRDYGAVPVDDVVGRVVFRIWPSPGRP